MEPLSSSLRSRFDYYYSLSSPQRTSAAATIATSNNLYINDNHQNASLFGDPVPPPSTSSISESLSSQLYQSFSRHIDQKMALSYQKADLWYNNKNIFKPKPSTASIYSNRSESPSISTIETSGTTTEFNAPSTTNTIKRTRAKTAMVKKKSAIRK